MPDEIALWMGVPLSEMPRDELEQALIDTSRQLQEAQDRAHKASVGRVHDLVAMRRSFG